MEKLEDSELAQIVIDRAHEKEKAIEIIPERINLLRASCVYPCGKTAEYYGAENKKNGALR